MAQTVEPPVQHQSQDPRQGHETPPFPEQKQQPPGSEAEMMPKPDHGERSYTGLGRLKGKSAIITGADVLISDLNEHDDAKETTNRLMLLVTFSVLRAEGCWLSQHPFCAMPKRRSVP